eukprot:1152733-Pelagomonas_calceolata.AAC.1
MHGIHEVHELQAAAGAGGARSPSGRLVWVHVEDSMHGIHEAHELQAAAGVGGARSPSGRLASVRAFEYEAVACTEARCMHVVVKPPSLDSSSKVRPKVHTAHPGRHPQQRWAAHLLQVPTQACVSQVATDLHNSPRNAVLTTCQSRSPHEAGSVAPGGGTASGPLPVRLCIKSMFSYGAGAQACEGSALPLGPQLAGCGAPDESTTQNPPRQQHLLHTSVEGVRVAVDFETLFLALGLAQWGTQQDLTSVD